MKSLETNFVGCLGLPKESGALALIEMLKRGGGTILTTTYGRVEKHPERVIDANGNIIIGLGVEHPLLGKGAFHGNTPAAKHEYGTGRVAYIQDERRFIFSQHVEEKQPLHWDEVATRQVDFITNLYAQLRPGYGWADEAGLFRSDRHRAERPPKYLFWCNVFGPGLVNQIGRDFLLRASAWRTQEFEDGGILCVVEESYHKWHRGFSKETLDYFRAKLPEIRPYRAKPVRLPSEIVRIVQIDEATCNETVVYERGAKKKPKRKRD